MNILSRINRFFAPDDIHRQLYPAPKIEFSIRKYSEDDSNAVLGLYDSNALNRFPDGHRTKFQSFLTKLDRTYFVVEHKAHGIIASGGIESTGPQTHVMCYGLVDPKFHGMRIGSTLALARLSFATRCEGPNFSFIFSVHDSFGFYSRFGYVEKQKWKAENGLEYPVGVLGYQADIIKSIRKELIRRSHSIDDAIPLFRSSEFETNIVETSPGVYNIETNKKPNQ